MSFDEEITKEEVEQCKQKDLLEELMKEMAGEFPAFGEVFVNERDLYLCYSLQMASMRNSMSTSMMAQKAQKVEPQYTVGVLGIGHCAGVARHWDKKWCAEEIPRIMIIPRAPLSTRVFKYTVKYGTMAAITYGVYRLTAPYLRRLL